MHIVLELTDSWARGWVRYSNDLGDGPPTPPAFTTSAYVSLSMRVAILLTTADTR